MYSKYSSFEESMEGPEICQVEIAVSLKKHGMTDVTIAARCKKELTPFSIAKKIILMDALPKPPPEKSRTGTLARPTSICLSRTSNRTHLLHFLFRNIR